jgi:hypothetical protein
MLRPSIVLVALLVLAAQSLSAQVRNAPGKGLAIGKATDEIVLDGKLEEKSWTDAAVARDFFLNYPVDTAFAEFQTEARVTFDDHNLYVSFVCYDDKTPDVVQSLRRDFDFDINDNVTVIIGPYNDGINGFFFTTTPLGVQLEGTVSGAGANGDSYNDTWDNKWYNRVIKEDNRWVAELAIPFKSFRYKSEAAEWNITFMRYDLKRNRTSSWIATPIQFIPASFAYSGKLVWKDRPPHHATNISLIPFVAGGMAVDEEAVPVERSNDLQAGFDAKIGVTPSMNLDLTINPDFSQVEVDRQVINLTRFEFQFPERRQFFLENNDLFEGMGFPEARTFFSRRIGIAQDSTENLVRVPILYGARLSGSVTDKWRVSMLNMQTREKEQIGLPQQNFSVATVQRNFWKQSSIQFSFVNKQSLGVGEADSLKYFHDDLWREKWNGVDSVNTLNKYNRVAGVDLELRSADNTWYSSSFYSHSFDDFSVSKRQAGGGFVSYTKRNLSIYVGETFVQENFNAEVGYVPTAGVYPGIVNSFAGADITLYPKDNKSVVNHGPEVNAQLSHLPDGTITDKFFNTGYNFNFQNTSGVNVNAFAIYSRLTNTFNPIDEDEYTNFQEGDEYSWVNVELNYDSDQRKKFQYEVGTSYGGFYNGTNFTANGEVNYRYQPYGSVSVRFDYNDLRLPDNYGKEKLFIVSPRMDLTFTDKIFLTTFVQYNTLADNVNLNARFQWRYKPASDFFIVYTENYLPGNLTSKNRALVFKLTYWLNL